jgi:hypothetical protein
MRFGFLISLLCHLTALVGGVFLFGTKLENLPKSTIVPINLVTISDNTDIKGTYIKKPPIEDKIRVRKNDVKSSSLNNERDFKDPANEFDLNSDASGKYVFDLEKLALMVDKNQENSMQRLNNSTSLPDDNDTIERLSKGEGNEMTVSEVNALQSAMYRCWRIPVDAVNPENLVVKLEVEMLPGGFVQNVQVINRSEQRQLDPGNTFWDVAEQRAVRAVSQCAPYSFLPLKKYNQWKKITLNFRPEL